MLFKKNIVRRIVNRLKTVLFGRPEVCDLKRLYRYDLERMLVHLGGHVRNSQASGEAFISLHYHCVEKGLTMPDFAPGHGENVVLQLVKELSMYEKNGYDTSVLAFCHGVAVLREYADVHRQWNYTLAPKVAEAIESITSRYPGRASCQEDTTPAAYWADAEAPFPRFALSRHSVRHFDGRAPESDMMAALNCARCAPLACNRNLIRVHYFKGEQAQKVLACQNGNRGFGHLCEQVLVVTGDMRAMLSANERNCLYTNAGIFTMNLMYALHYHHVAHCVLNWGAPIDADCALREVSGIPDHELVAVMIACGKAPSHFRVTLSPREPLAGVLVEHPEA